MAQNRALSCSWPAFMTNRPPAPGTYDPRDWKCPNCKTLNFKKRKNCLSCSTDRPPQTKDQIMPDWRTGKKDCGANVNADWTCRPCGRFNFGTERFCTACGLACQIPPQNPRIPIPLTKPLNHQTLNRNPRRCGDYGFSSSPSPKGILWEPQTPNLGRVRAP